MSPNLFIVEVFHIYPFLLFYIFPPMYFSLQRLAQRTMRKRKNIPKKADSFPRDSAHNRNNNPVNSHLPKSILIS